MPLPDQAALDRLLRGIDIPPRPAILASPQRNVPLPTTCRPARVAQIIRNDAPAGPLSAGFIGNAPRVNEPPAGDAAGRPGPGPTGLDDKEGLDLHQAAFEALAAF